MLKFPREKLFASNLKLLKAPTYRESNKNNIKQVLSQNCIQWFLIFLRAQMHQAKLTIKGWEKV